VVTLQRFLSQTTLAADDRLDSAVIAKPLLFTKFMGSKSAILGSIFERLSKFEYNSVLDAFSGSGAVAYEFKKRRKQVTTNDFLHFSYEICKAVIENSKQKLDEERFAELQTLRPDAPTTVRDFFEGVYFTHEECYFLDSLWANISDMPESHKKHLAIAAACRACQKRYPRGIFTVTGNKGRDHRRDFRIELPQHFVNAVESFNDAVFDNGRDNDAYCSNIMDFKKTDFDLVYLDPPYWSPLSDNDYVRRYHFIEGYSKYWKDLKIDENTKTKKFSSNYYPTPFSRRESATTALNELFQKFADSIIAISYSSNSFPDRAELKTMLGKVKDEVQVEVMPHTYSFGNQGSTVGWIKNKVDEYLFIGYNRNQRPAS
jgi:DNA adenine methylase